MAPLLRSGQQPTTLPHTPALLSGPELLSATVATLEKKAARPPLPTLVLALLAGAFIGLGGLMYTLVAGGGLGFAATHLLGGLTFCLGLVLVVVAGGELLTSNLMLSLALVRGQVTWQAAARNLGLVLLGNLLGALLLITVVYLAGVLGQNGGKVMEAAVAIAEKKSHLSTTRAFFSAILCNFLVCLAVWMTYAGRSLTDKVVAIIFPITAFVAVGFEHSVANMYFLPLGMLLDPVRVPLEGALHNLLFVLLGNAVGGGLIVAMAYHLAYPASSARPQRPPT